MTCYVLSYNVEVNYKWKKYIILHLGKYLYLKNKKNSAFLKRFLKS